MKLARMNNIDNVPKKKKKRLFTEFSLSFHSEKNSFASKWQF